MDIHADITRRAALKALPASLAVVIPFPDATATAEARMLHHLREFQRAAQEFDPRIVEWKVWNYSELTEGNPGAWMVVALREPSGEVAL